MEKENKMIKEVDTDFELTEEDIQHLLKSEEDVRLGRVCTMEEFFEKLEKEHGFKYIET